ncbi:hypothetical protein [Vulcanisaeta distributa]|uniref:hypothetical protein n=1 Tax=Vulcanisaeta distributa TaxID=164451 RepID=UPI0006CF70B3|nr:hypothetical protein [Vulcanisaeta distributa]
MDLIRGGGLMRDRRLINSLFTSPLMALEELSECGIRRLLDRAYRLVAMVRLGGWAWRHWMNYGR